jgi:ketosteroid isomerase-like protein
MNRSKKVFSMLVAACAIALPALAADDATRIRAGTASWVQSFNAGNAGAVVALYADDAALMPPNAPQARGVAAIKEAVAKEIAGAKKAGITLVLGTDDVGVIGDMAWHAGTYAVKDKAGKTVEAGKFLEAWERKNGKWRIARDMWNSDNAPAAPAAPSATPATEPKKK